MKKLILLLILLLFASSATAAMTNTITGRPNAYWFTGDSKDDAWLWAKEVETRLEAWTFDGGTTITFPTNGLTIDNATNNVLEINENSDELKLTFGSNTVALSSTDVTAFTFGSIVPSANQILFNPVTDAVGTVEGTVFYDSDDDNLYVRTTAGWVDLTASAASGTLDAAYDSGGAGVGKKIDADTGGIEIEVDDNKATTTEALLLDYDDSTNNNKVLVIQNAGTGNSIDLQGTSGKDIEGTGDTWNVTTTGVLTAVSGSFTGAAGITLENGGTITNTPDGYFKLTDGGEDLSLYLNANAVTLSSTSGVNTIAFGAVDDLSGIGTIAFDAAASTVTLTATGAAQDLTIGVAGAFDSSLVLQSSGTAADALQIITTAGGIDITNGGAAGGEDLDINGVLASVKINADEDVADAVTVTASAGGIDITADGAAGKDLDLVCTNGSTNLSGGEAAQDAVVISAGAGGMNISTAATFDIAATATGGKVILTGNEDAAGAVSLLTSGGGGTSETIVITNDQGTGDDSINMDSTAGGFDLDVAKSVAIGSSEAQVDAIQIQASAGGIDVDAANDIDIKVTSDGAGEDLLLTQVGGNDSSITLTAAGTGADAIGLQATAGGIDIDATNSTLAITNTANGAADDLTLSVVGAFDSSIILTSAGTGADAISLQIDGTGGGLSVDTDDGAISIVADGAANGDITIDAQDNLSLITSDTLTLTNTTKIVIDGMVTQLIEIEGTANDFETTLSITDPSADNTIAFPDDSGSVAYQPTGTTTKDATDAAIPITHAIVTGTSGAASAWSLPNGENGQILVVAITTDGGEATITPVTSTGWATAVLTDDGDTVSFMYVDDTVGWVVLGTTGIGGMPNITQ